MLRHLRMLDRRHNQFHYPHLSFPDIYLIDGGYEAFCDRFAPSAADRGRRRAVDELGAQSTTGGKAHDSFVVLATAHGAIGEPPLERLLVPHAPPRYTPMNDRRFVEERAKYMRLARQPSAMRKSQSMGDLARM
eukprot:TRINITY_DN155_c1_g1_i1.p1 TRINITY_DN155_c1_g1~~TRINITY_DN155_c1_g1_i1.p1  ORF type:complete len:134 (-),score=74.71 TRINITY_DN155_c1_g1_i1:35-436(-)